MPEKVKKEYWKKFFANIGEFTNTEIIEKVKAGNIQDSDFMKKYATQDDFNKLSVICLEEAANRPDISGLFAILAYVALCTDDTVLFKQVPSQENGDIPRQIHIAFLPPDSKDLDDLIVSVKKERAKKGY